MESNEKKAERLTTEFIERLEQTFGPDDCTIAEFVGVMQTAVDGVNERLQSAVEEAGA